MTEVESGREPVRVRTEGNHILLTLTPQQADELANAIRRNGADTEEWLTETAQTLALTAGQLDPARQARHRRPLRVAGVRPTPAPRAAATSDARSVATPREVQPATKAGSGLAAAVAGFADAIALGDDTMPPPAQPPARRGVDARRAMTLQEILEAAANTSKAEPAHA